MGTIRMSKNLMSLTERLPKKKYGTRARSNELNHNNSQESLLMQNASVALLPPA